MTLGLSAAMLPALLTPIASAAGKDPLGRPDLEKPRSVKVSTLTRKANSKAQRAVTAGSAADAASAKRARGDQSRSVTWPGSGSATLRLPEKGKTKAKAGKLPLALERPSGKKKVASEIEVNVLDQKAAKELGVKGVVLTVTGPKGGGSAELGLDYSAFASAYGADWAGRLQVMQLPDCALNDPATTKCRSRVPLEFTNQRGTEEIVAPLEFAPAARSASGGDTMVLALAAGTQSASGDLKATPLAASSTWSAGGSSGTFSTSYPLSVPPAAAGPLPELKISYDSGMVDGRTATSNNQGTVLGEGFDITSSYIERQYGSCDDDGQDDKFDRCWKYENASLVLNGQANELVKDDTTGQWHLKNDDASTVKRHTGADNGDDNGEYWTVTTGQGVTYTFGLNKLDGASADMRTKSVWTVPVFGDDEGEPGYADGTSFSGRDKKQAWRWNLDLVEDTHGNASTYWYEDEANYYDKLGDDTTGTAYTRGGYLKEIRYGQRKGALFSATPAASNKVVFSYAERCLASGTGCDSLTEDTRDNWPDVPFDTVCKEGDKCTGNVSPTFFTRKRMTGVTTYAWDAAAATPDYAPIDNWSFKQLYLDPGDTGDSTDQALWLDEIKHTGKRGTDLALSPIKFTHEFRPNRVDGPSDDILSFEKPRLKTIVSETGAQTIVSYMEADCVYGQTMPKVDENTKRCYPVMWAPNGEQEPILDWFQKYPVSAVSTTDPFGGSEAVQHTYQYSGGGAWHYTHDPMTPAKERTWSTWRGYEKVTHLTGASGTNQLKNVTVYMRGMNGDRVLGPDGKTPDPDKRKSVSVTGIKAGAATDNDWYAGFTRETVTYNGAAEVSGSINSIWSKKTATQHKSYANIEAYMVRDAAQNGRINVTSSGTAKDRNTAVLYTYDDYGMVTTAENVGDKAVTGDETCTRTWYARNADSGINSLVSRTRTTSKTCATADSSLDLPTDSSRPGDLITDTATVYDNPAASGWSADQKPTKGKATWTGRAKSYSAGTPTWQKVTGTTYDSLGRPLVVTDTNDLAIKTTVYTPATSGPLTSTTVEDAKKFKTTVVVDIAAGKPVKTTDPNGRITESELDSLGRVTKVWLPNRSKALGKTPNQTYEYNITNAAMPWTATSTLKGDASGYNTSYEFFDSLLRPRQVQKPSPVGGRLIGQTLYDSRGLAVSTQSDIWNESSAPSSTPVEIDGGQAPMQVDTIYDGAGRAVKAVTKNYNVTRWTLDTAYTGDTVSTSAPAGGQASTLVTNALGQTVEQRTYPGSKPEGSTYTSTKFTYRPAGQQATVTGPDSSKWTYEYDLFGRQTKKTDPDTGTTTVDFDSLDRPITSKDAEGRILLTGYDDLGRKTGLWHTSKTDANKLAAWTFDTLAKGKQDTAVRYDGGLAGKAYTDKVTKYTPTYEVESSQLLLPADDELVKAGVPQTLSFTTGYRPDGTVSQTSQPAVGGLPAETVSYTYNATGQQLTSKGTTGYLQGARFSPQGDLRQLALGMDSAKKAYLNYEYEAGTRRLIRSYVTDDVHSYMPQELKFTQDDAGNVTSIFDPSSQDGTGKPDYQCFTYDGYSRMTEAWTPRTADCATAGRTQSNIDGAAPYWTSYTYTEGGQRDSQTEHTPSGNSTTEFTYGPTGNNQPHPLTKTVTGTNTDTYEYDKTGNTTKRPGSQGQQTLDWNAEGRLAKTIEVTDETNYLYGADGELLIRRDKGDGDTVLYLGATEVRLTTQGATKNLSGTRYYTANGQQIALRTAASGTSGSKLTFVASDHHGTAGLALDANTWAATKRYTTPFGESRGTEASNWPDDKSFLGKPADESTGLTHIGAREYDAAIGQFVSVDPILEVTKHQTLNGYSYAANSPVTYSDPTGTCLDPGNGHCHQSTTSGSGKGGNTYDPSFPINTSSSTSGDRGPTLNDLSLEAYVTTIWLADTGKDYYRNEGNTSYSEFRRALIKYQGAYDGPVNDAQWQMWLYGYSEDVIDNFGPCLIFDCKKAVSVDDLRTIPLNSEGFMEMFGRAFVDGLGSRIGLEKGAKGGGKASLGGCTRCFLAGTDVLMADGTTKNIEEVELGDKVLATDPETGEQGSREVTRLIRTEDDKHFNSLSIATGEGIEELTATHEHPFWSPSEKRWIPARELAEGMTLLTDSGATVTVTANRPYTEHARTYNLTVDDLHTFYVLAGKAPILVHNSGGHTPDDGDVTVGRWMSSAEHQAMMETGRVQRGGGGFSYVVYPANREAYISARPGSVYVEFDVPRSALIPGGRPGDYKMSDSDTIFARLAKKKGQPVPQLPAAKNIKLGGWGCS
ncbi:polymorphic toxin-type HINT domain-containing protein [Streptomyces sp. NPDC050418]|uniref:TreTu family toxin n=1 Tax=Streptomyces sp. NPDC050418 TaxID=3365612 RepID=UPI00379A1626